jgi:hypothetical protein
MVTHSINARRRHLHLTRFRCHRTAKQNQRTAGTPSANDFTEIPTPQAVGQFLLLCYIVQYQSEPYHQGVQGGS